jgi:type I restriction enzyme S subunit
MSRAMKDSGIPWIGEIPKGWDTLKIKQVMRNKSIKGFPNETVLSLYRDYGVVPKDSRDDNHNVTSEDTSSYKLVEIGDFVINKMKAWQGSMAVSQYRGIISPAYYICHFKNDGLDRRYIHYLLRNDSYKAEYMRLSTGLRVGQWDLNIDDFLSIPMVLPPVPEQQRIAEFLDRKCGEIDEAIALQEEFIEELKSYKQSVITEAVTRGLNPNVEFKDSGIDWIGKIPEKWIIVQTKRIVRNHLQGYYDADGYVMSGYRLLRITDLLDNGNLTLGNAPFVKETPNIKEFVLQKGDFCFARTGGAGCFGFVSDNIEPAVFASYLIRFRFSGQNNNYLRYYFLSYSFISEVNSLIHGGVNKNIHAENIKQTHLPIPPLNEQQQIADYLDTKCAEIDSLIAVKQQKIDELKDYKKSIIYEYVTGKKEI